MKREHIDIALAKRLREIQKEWKSQYGAISIVEITRILGEYGELDLKKVKEMQDKWGV